jgi:hypothetical protein
MEATVFPDIFLLSVSLSCLAHLRVVVRAFFSISFLYISLCFSYILSVVCHAP